VLEGRGCGPDSGEPGSADISIFERAHERKAACGRAAVDDRTPTRLVYLARQASPTIEEGGTG
jgi:hypothetical protein